MPKDEKNQIVAFAVVDENGRTLSYHRDYAEASTCAANDLYTWDNERKGYTPITEWDGDLPPLRRVVKLVEDS